MSLAKLFYMKETFRENVRRWRQACFRQRSNSSPVTHHASYLTSLASRFTLETLEPRLLLSATPTEVTAAQALEPAVITVPAGALPSLDVDLNGQADALSDGILIIRHLFGFTGAALTNGVVDSAGQRTDPTAIQNYLNSISTALDVDLNQQADALSDGILIIRSLFGFTGTALTSGAIDPAGQRTDPAVIAAFLDNMNPQRELIAPLMTAGLQQDTGISTTDAITFNQTITGTLADINQIATFTAGFDVTPVGSFVNVLADLQATGVFTLSTARMNQLAGGTLADGAHTLHLRATDAQGNVATLDHVFTLDTLAPLSPTFDLAVTSDTGTVGDHETTAAIVTVKGQTDATTPIQLVGLGTSTLSNGTGTFQLPDLALAVGANAFTLRASDVAGNQSDFSRTITRLAATQQADVVLTWNQTMLEAIRLDATPPPMASRGMAMVSLAMYDVINAIEGTPGYYVSLPTQPGTSADAAAASAAHRVLSYLYPGQQAFFDTQLAASLALVPDGAAETNGITLGQSIANAIIAIRATDGWNDFVEYVPGNQPGDWQQTAPMYDVALLPQWADLTPFALTSPTQFTPAGPPALTSQAYADAFNEVKALGSATGSTRTADQTQIARFWADGGGTYTPPGHWDQIAQQIALQQGNSLSANARLFAQLNVALADAAITAWHTKYAHEFWRPITAIQQADLAGNALTVADPAWSSFLITPPFPEYVSGHSTFSGAAAEILTSLFGNNVAFTTESLGLPGVQRSFTNFEQAAQEAGKSRIYGGIHFEFSNQDGLASGKALADFVLNRFTVTTDTQGPKILLNQQSGTVTKANLTLTGQVLDNLSGVAALQAKLDNGAFAPVALSNTGTFSLPTTLLLDGTADGVHQLTFQATDNQGNNGTALFSFTLDTVLPTLTLATPTVDQVLTDGAGVSGIADATGSALVELCYQFDSSVLAPISFDLVSGSFDAPLDLSKLPVGAHVLSLRAQDAAGNVTTLTRNVSLAAPIPLTIAAVTPQPGASDVGSTFRPQVFFSLPVNMATLTNNNFYATDTTGTKLAATIVPAQDGTFAWLFFTNPMPGASTITIHVDGTTILAAGDGQALDADGNGTPGGTVTSTFSTVSLVPLQGTTLSGRVLDPGPDLRMGTFDDIRAGADGVLHTSDDVFLNPIAGATVYILGLESQAVVTDAQGNFSFSAVPSGTIKLAIDGRTATNAPAGFYFPEMVMDLQIEVGQANTAMGTMGTWEAKAANLTRPEIYLPRLQTSILQAVSNTQTTMVGMNAGAAPNLTDQQRQFLTLEVQPGSLIGLDGQPLANGQVGISTVPPELVRDMLPPGLLQHTFDITIQAPDAATFNTPLQMTFPNVFNAAPGTKLNFLSFDHTTGRLVIEGTGTVSQDGQSVTTDPGTGITKPGWHGMTPPGVTPGKTQKYGNGGTQTKNSDGSITIRDANGRILNVIRPGPSTPPSLLNQIYGQARKYYQTPVDPNAPRIHTPTNAIGTRGLVTLPGLEIFAGHAMPGDLGDLNGEFDLQLRFLGAPLSPTDASMIEVAARRWEQLVIGDLPDVFTDLGLVDDLVIDIEVVPLDGDLGVLATAAPTVLRPGSFLPARGIFQLDLADLAQLSASGALYEAALHEIGHILGIGTIWDALNLVATSPSGERGFVGPQATAAFNALFNVTGTAVPIEVDGGPLTADGHWSETVFANELMTGFFNGGINPLSVVSVASLADVGYQVDLSQADSYSPPTQPGVPPASSGSNDPSAAMRGLLAVTALVPSAGDLPFVFRGDFGTAASPVEAGYVPVTPDMLYSQTQGYGWQFGQVTAVDQTAAVSLTNLTRDYVTTDGAVFAVDVPNGLYLVSVLMGEGARSHRQMQTYAEDVLVNNTTTQAGEVANPAYWVLVSDGQLNLVFVGTDNVVLNAIEITQLDQTTEIFVPVEVQGRFAVAAENLVTGFVTRAKITVTGDGLAVPDGLFLSQNTPYRYWVLDLDSLDIGVTPFRTPFSGQQLLMPSINLFGDLSTDTDGDGLTDQSEFVVGTVARSADSDADGVSDLAEIQQGLNPLDNRGFPAGIIAATALLGEAKEVVLEGALTNPEQLTAYVATGSYGLAIIDATQFQKPIVLSQLDLPGDATDVSVDSQLGIAVVAANVGGLHFVDVSNPTTPTLIRTIAATPNQLEVFDGFAYVTVGSELRRYNILTGELVQSVSLGGGTLIGLAREGSTLYTTDSSNKLQVLSISAGSLTVRGAQTIVLGFGQTLGKVFVGNSIAYIGAEGGFNGGFATVDVSNSDVPTLLSGVDSAGIAGKRIVANGSGLGVSVGRPGGVGGANVLDVVSLTDPANTNNFLTRFALPADPFSVAIGAGIAFVADGTGGLQVVNYRAFDNQGVAPTVAVTSPILDLDPVTPGLQVTEGTTIPLQVSANDDVQVRNVELLVNGVVVSNDVSFPFDLSAIALGSTPSATTTTVQVRATDTGGNVALSNVLTFNLVPDTFAPILVGDNISGGRIHDQSFKVVQLQFSEALDANTVTAQNFQLLGPNGLAVAPTVVQLIGGGTFVQLGYSLFNVGTNQLVIKSSAVTDRAGNAFGTQDIVIPFEIVSHFVPPLDLMSPLGGLVYSQQLFGHVAGPSSVETFTMTLDGGQVLTVGINPDSAALRTRVEVLNALGQVLASADGQAGGTGVSVQAVPIPTSGVYTIRVQSLSGAGDFKGLIYVNAVMETELFGGPSNDTITTATLLSSSSIPLQGQADRVAAVGFASGGDDFYRLDLTQGQIAYFMLSTNDFGSNQLTFDLRDALGAPLTVGVPEANNLNTSSVAQSIRAFRAPQTGAYYLHVSGTTFASSEHGGLPTYVLVATRGSAFDLEPNDSVQLSESIFLTGQALGSVGTRTVLPTSPFNSLIPDPEDNYTIAVNEGDVLEITTTTPGVGLGEPGNGLDPFLQLVDPIFGIVWSDDNSAPDGRNAVISATAPTTGLYRVRVSPNTGAGDYTVRVTGATGTVAVSATVASSSLTTKGTDASLTLGFSTPILLTTVQPGDVTINGVAASTVSVVDATTLRFTANGVAAGPYTAVLGAGAVQDIRETPNAAFSRTFAGDTTAPVVVASSVSPLTLVAPNEPGVFTPFVVTVTFSEDLDQTVLDAQDMQLKSGDANDSFFVTAATFTYSPVTDQLQMEFPIGLSEGQFYELRLVSGLTGLRDLAGNPLDGSPSFPLPSGQTDSRTEDFVVEFGVGPATPAFASVDRRDTPGSLIFSSQDVVSVFGAVGEVDTWTVPLEAGQVLAVGLFPSSTIQGRLEVFDPNGVKIGSITGSGIGKNGALVDLPVVIAGTYRVEVASLAGVGPYHVGFALNASVDVEDVALLVGHNNTVATAQSIQGSAVSLQGAVDRLAVFGDFETTVDVDVYAFQLTAGQPTTFILDGGVATTIGPQIELLDQAGSLIATRTAQTDGSVRIDDFVASQTGTYFARLSSGFDATFYNFIVVRGATFEAPLPDGAAQNISAAARVLGIIDTSPSGAGGGIRVAVLGGIGATELVTQLNDDTFFNFDAVVVGQTDIDTVAELHNFDVVVIGDPGSRAQLQGAVEQALQNWWFSGEGAIVGTGGIFTAAGPGTGGTLFGLDFIIPVDLNGGVLQAAGDSTLTINAVAHEITQGLTSFVIPGPIEAPLGDADQAAGFAPAEVLGRVVVQPFDRPAVAVMSNGDSRSVYVAPGYFNTTATELRSGSADRLLEQSVAWASGIDFFDSYNVQANVGDQLVIKTTTPFDGPNLPQNLLDPRIELLNSAGTVVAINDNGAADGKNALINYTVPVGASGQYTVRLRGSQTGEYTLAVTGATGIAPASSVGTATLTAEVSLSTTSPSSPSFDGSLAYVQQSWVKNYVAPTADTTADDEELLIQLV